MESEAFFKLAEEIERRAIKRQQQDSWLSDDEAMALFGIRNKAHWSVFKSKHGLPGSKIGHLTLFSRKDLDKFILSKKHPR